MNSPTLWCRSPTEPRKAAPLSQICAQVSRNGRTLITPRFGLQITTAMNDTAALMLDDAAAAASSSVACA